ncbi:hypothetical protein PFICI_08979 [Pestalotiopsis fici W106-1]|uniref:SnoaL-like domain-containing protein n=1 Tax=Pestalotiopsis fici (strain W106-1 / CGMCC3.15140) TaxID=1229662 RepID=W3X1T4_PESFW|nr:uncharacterized protein PFICI_08979 [Pestalotiopsis fici W106-1]ETS79126.1 hypothetical protein PFICI_08979 [Pestalotiopsis fici W106-1]
MEVPYLSVQDLLDYLRAFNSRDYAAQHAFYAPDIELVIPDPEIGTLVGSAGVMKHYNVVHADAEENVIPLVVLSDRGNVFLQMESYFRYLKATNQTVHGYTVVPGDVTKISCCALYELDKGNKMKRITCFLFKQEKLGQVDVEERIRDTESRAQPDLKL